MVSARTIVRCLSLAGALACTAPAVAEGSVSERHAAWQGCLSEAFTLRAVLSGRTLAADTALRACREREAAYLAALSQSPLLDEDDVSRVRPELLVRARTWLLSGKASHSL